MARYIGPKTKIARKFGAAIYGDDKSFEKRKNQPPGQHGPNKRRGAKKSEYAVQLAEKQKAKYTYGILERQFANLFDKAHRSKGVTGEVLLQLCESRLDNVVYRLGFSKTRAGARQMVTHGHIKVNGKKIDLPSYIVKVGDEIRLKDKMAETANYKVLVEENKTKELVKWIEKLANGGVVKSEPTREMIDQAISEQLVVEFYSR